MNSEAAVRLFRFAGVFVAMAVLAALLPLRRDLPGRAPRRPGAASGIRKRRE